MQTPQTAESVKGALDRGECQVTGAAWETLCLVRHTPAFLRAGITSGDELKSMELLYNQLISFQRTGMLKENHLRESLFITKGIVLRSL